MLTSEKIKGHLRPGRVYRRADLEQWSRAIDRDLRRLLQDGSLTKVSGGLYYCPRKTAFGTAPADDKTLVKAFLKDDRFLLTSLNAYNALGIGTTQLYNATIVYNHKRHGRIDLGGRVFDFRRKPWFPTRLTPDFLLVDLVNNLNELAEDREKVLSLVEKKAASMNPRKLSWAVRQYGGVSARKFFARVLKEEACNHATH